MGLLEKYRKKEVKTKVEQPYKEPDVVTNLYGFFRQMESHERKIQEQRAQQELDTEAAGEVIKKRFISYCDNIPVKKPE